MSLFFYLFTFAISLWHCSVCNQSTWYSVTRTRF